EDLAGLGAERLLLGAPVEHLRVLEQRDGEPERDAQRAEARSRVRETPGVAGLPGAETDRVRVEEGRANARRESIEEPEELVRPRRVAESERRLERLDDAVLHALEVRPERL